ncbi:ribosome biogenesis GTPase YlqF [Proteocatella sphenisci]|uniref:ribosome biogenesis GTPase YlqF n=1 Tax=Proteocatella sphenisci TaxID=181070 RepID=UPI00048A5152|nr:ribosome biogenesis GTPase YlqF [Proteocatella sphenisci]
MEERMHINWYPGHMKKTKELLQTSLSLVDIVVEVVDSRIPLASKNPDIDKIAANKPRIIVLNKEDLANPSMTGKWIDYYQKKGFIAIAMNASSGNGLDRLITAIDRAYSAQKEKFLSKGMINRAPRIMIVGIPNSGKSSLINKLTGRKSAHTGDRPGVTKGKQWVRVKGNLEMLDTPGILWPKFEDDRVAMLLAFTGAIKDDVLNVEEIGFQLLHRIKNMDHTLIEKRYGIEVDPEQETIEIMNEIAYERKFILRGKEIDYHRTGQTILNEFRAGLIGKVTLETPPEHDNKSDVED